MSINVFDNPPAPEDNGFYSRDFRMIFERVNNKQLYFQSLFLFYSRLTP